MTPINRIFICISFVSIFLITFELFYVHATRTLTQKALEKKAFFISSVGLTDLSLVTETRYVRHRSLSDFFSFFGDGPELLEYFPSTFIYYYSSNFKTSPSQIVP